MWERSQSSVAADHIRKRPAAEITETRTVKNAEINVYANCNRIGRTNNFKSKGLPLVDSEEFRIWKKEQTEHYG